MKQFLNFKIYNANPNFLDGLFDDKYKVLHNFNMLSTYLPILH